MSETKEKLLLTKSSDFNGWYRKMVGKLERLEYCDENGKIFDRVGNLKERPSYLAILECIDTDVAGGIDSEYIKTGTKLLEHLTNEYSGGNKFVWWQKYRDYKMLDPDVDMYLKEIDKLKVKVKLGGGKISPHDEYVKLTGDLHQERYFNFITETRLKYEKDDKDEITIEDITAIRERLKKTYEAMPKLNSKDRYRNGAYSEERARKSQGSRYEKRHCTICEETIGDKMCAKGKSKVKETHNTEDHIDMGENKPRQQYTAPVLLDTCASTHLVKDIPKILDTSERGIVKGSVKDAPSAKIIGKGKFKVDKLKFTASVAPGLDANMLSAGKLIKEGYAAVLKKNIQPGIDIEIKKNDEIMATGHVTENNMIQLNKNMKENNENTEKSMKTVTLQDHIKFGHQGQSEDCKTCIEAKRRKKNTVKGKGREYQPLEKISMDMQGPMSVKGIDGAKYNMKIVDSLSNYITVVPTIDKSSNTTANILEYFIKRNERQTGKKVKFAVTDGGTEFYGEFLDLITKEGIQKIRGEDYEHSFPPDAENANGILNRMTRSNLLSSQLPPQYWPFVLKYSAYCYNRFGDPSPYEKLYGRKPRTDHLKPFGTVCYAYKAPEHRDFKFEPVRIKCRFLGYADDDEVEVMDAYVVMNEKDRHIFYSKDVVFPKIPEKITKLTGNLNDPTADDLYDENEDYGDEDYVDDEAQNVLNENSSTEANTQSSQSQPASDFEINPDAMTEMQTGIGPILRSNPRRMAMYPAEVQQIRDDVLLEDQGVIQEPNPEEQEVEEMENDDSDSDFTPETSRRSQHAQSDWADIEYEEIWESAFTRFDVLHQLYRTHKQDPSIPKNYKQLMEMKSRNDPEYQSYAKAMEMEESNMEEQQVYSKSDIVTALPKDANGRIPHYVDSIWAFAKMFDEKGNLLKYKARLCGRGFREIQGIDYEEVYSPTVKQKLVRAIVAIAASKRWNIYQDDCKAAYLNAILPKGKWLKLPDGRFTFIKKCLYGLKESAREWFKLVKSYIMKLGFTQNQADPCTFFKLSDVGELEIVLALFVDDTLTTGNEKSVQNFRKEFRNRFRVSEKGGICKHFLSIRFSDDEEFVYMDQSTYINQKLKDYEKYLGDPRKGCASALLPNFQDTLKEANESTETEPEFPYREMVGSLVYAANGTRFDITAAVSIVSRFGNNPKKIHCDMVRKIYLYLRANPKKLRFKKGAEIKLVGYCDSSLGNLEDYSSLAGFCFVLGDSIISWKSFKEPVVALSTAEAEYIALTPAVQECIYLQQFLKGLGYVSTKTEIHEDNNACIALAKNPQDKKRTRHIQIRFHWIREQLENGIFTLLPTRTHDQLADLFTKGLHGPQLRTISTKLGLVHDSLKQGESEDIDASLNINRLESEETLI